jgi:hypothetical protein
MDSSILLYIGSFLPFAWGVSHLFPTRNIVKGFGEISIDNRRIVAMEWITEGVALIFIGILVALVTYIDQNSEISQVVYWTSFAVLNVLSLVSSFTGFRISFFLFKLCPFIFTGSSILILLGILTRS